MNVEPHVHEARIERTYQLINQGDWVVRYGDTTVPLCSERKEPSRRQLQRAVRKAIRKHDAGSIRAGNHAELLRAVNDSLKAHAEQWGLETLRGDRTSDG